MCPHIKKLEAEKTRNKLTAFAAGAGQVILQAGAGVAHVVALAGIAGSTMIANTQTLPFVHHVMPMTPLVGVNTLEVGFGFVLMGIAGFGFRAAAEECAKIYEGCQCKAKTFPVASGVVSCKEKKQVCSCYPECLQPTVSL